MEHGLQFGGSGKRAKSETQDDSRKNREDDDPNEMDEVTRNAFKLKVIALLMQMNSAVVRGDFLKGKFGPTINTQILPALDQMRWTILPRWQSEGSCSARFLEAAQHLDSLVEKSRATFKLDMSSNDQQSYGEWMFVLEILANNEYWQKVPGSQRCTHNYDEELSKPRLKALGSTKPQRVPDIIKKRVSIVKGKAPSSPANSSEDLDIEEIVPSSTDEDSASETDSSTESDKFD